MRYNNSTAMLWKSAREPWCRTKQYSIYLCVLEASTSEVWSPSCSADWQLPKQALQLLWFSSVKCRQPHKCMALALAVFHFPVNYKQHKSSRILDCTQIIVWIQRSVLPNNHLLTKDQAFFFEWLGSSSHGMQHQNYYIQDAFSFISVNPKQWSIST